MNIKNIIPFALLAISLSACDNEADSDLTQANAGNMVFSASSSASLQKASTNYDGTEFLFSPNESIVIYNSNTSDGYKFTSGNNAASRDAYFVGSMGAEASKATNFYAVLPYEAASGFNNGKLKVALKSEQTAVAGSFDKSAGIMVSQTSNSDKSFMFRNVCSYARLQVSQNFTSIKIEGNNGELLAGVANVNPATGELSSISSASKSVTISGNITPGTYYAAILPANMTNGFTVTAITPAGEQIVKKIATNVNFSRNTINTIKVESNSSNGCTLLNKAKLQAAVPYTEATKLVFDLKKNVNTSNFTATGIYVDDEENNLQVYRRGTEYYVLSECNGEIMAPEDCSGLLALLGHYNNRTAFKDIIFNSFNTQNVTDMGCMFDNCSSLTSLDLTNFDTRNVTHMSGMFTGCSSLSSLDITNFDTRNVTHMSSMFAGCSSLSSLDITNFDTRNVTSMYAMFTGCSSLSSLDITNFDTRNVTDMRWMFAGCSSLSSLDITNFDTRNVTYMAGMFSGCSSLSSLDITNFDTRNVTHMEDMFRNCSSLTSLDLTNFDTRNVTNMYEMFYLCSSLSSLDLTNFDTRNVTDMGWMFDCCSSLSSLDLTNFDTRNVTDMSYMFYGCKSLTSLDLTNFDTRNVFSMYEMFKNCKSLTSLDITNFDTRNVTDMEGMFRNCESLTSLDITNFDTRNVTYMNSMFESCVSLTSLDLTNFDTKNVINMYDMFWNCVSLKIIQVSQNFKYEQANVVNMLSYCSATGNYGPDNKLTLVR